VVLWPHQSKDSPYAKLGLVLIPSEGSLILEYTFSCLLWCLFFKINNKISVIEVLLAYNKVHWLFFFFFGGTGI
jgi:hypothetical protein